LYRSVCRRTYQLLLTVTGAQASVVEELNQDVWLSAIESIEGFDATRGAPHDWVLGIARFKGLTYVRKVYREQRVFSGRHDVLEKTVAASPENSSETEQMAMLRAAITSLPEQWQHLLRQKYESGLSVKEIAELAGTTPKAVESNLSRARQRIRELCDTTFREMRDL
jgi:RNA polymerase sigma factor (sigma-70 family)